MPEDGGYSWVSYAEAASHLQEAEKHHVSEKARSPEGFMGQYRGKTSSVMNNHPVREYKNQTWGQRRHNFIKRHLAQYNKKGGRTYRRWLALMMWAYKAEPVAESQTRRRRSAAPSTQLRFTIQSNKPRARPRQRKSTARARARQRKSTARPRPRQRKSTARARPRQRREVAQ